MTLQSAGGSRRNEFDALYSRFNREVWALAFARWLDDDSAMDIMQEAYLRLWREWEAGQEIQNPRAWLLRVARNLAEDYSKSAFRRNGTAAPETMLGIRSIDTTPMEKLEANELHQTVRDVLRELGPQDREILTLRYALDYSTEAIAETMGIETTAVHMRLSRARKRTADLLREQGVDGNE